MRAQWRDPRIPLREVLVRVERALATARVLFAVGLVLSISTDPSEPTFQSALTLQLLAAYFVFSLSIYASVRMVPSYLTYLRVVIHLVDVLLAGAIVSMTGGLSAFFLFSIFVVFAAAERWGHTVALVTGAAGVATPLAVALLAPLADFGAPVVALGRTLAKGGYLVPLTLIIIVLAGQERTLVIERTTLSRILAAIAGASTFTESLRLFMHECMVRLGSSKAILVVEDLDSKRIYLWKASRTTGAERATIYLQELASTDRDTYLMPAPREMLVWHVRKHRNTLRGRGLDAGTLTSAPIAGSFASRLLAQLGVSSVLAAEGSVEREWRVRLMLLDPAATRLPDLYFLRDLIAYVSPALHRDYLIRRVRSRVGATERVKLARELHDGLLQSLIALEMEIEVLRRQTNAPVPEPRLRNVRDQLRLSISEVRDVMLSLRLSEITSTDVLRTLADLAGRLRRESGLEVRLHSTSPTINCPPRACRHLAKIAQEALANIRKHSGARSVTIELTQTDRSGRLTIEDDGRGLKFKGRMNLDQLEATDLGPAVIKERVRAMGGGLIIDSRPGAGTRMEIEWPADPHV